MQPDADVIEIDLGDRDWSADRAARRPDRRLPRPVAALVVVAVVAAGMVAADRGRPLVDVPLWTVEGDAVAITADLVLLYRGPRPVAGSGEPLTAISAVTGTQLWQVRTERPITAVSPVGGGLLGLRAGDYSGTVPDSVVYVVDPADGTLVSTIAGEDVAGTPGNNVVVFFQPPTAGAAACRPEDPCGDLAGYDVRTGTEVWRLPYQPGVRPLWGGTQSLGLLDERGNVAMHDLTTARVTAERAIPGWNRGGDTTVPRRDWVALVDGVLLHAQPVAAADIRVTGIDISTGATWSTVVPAMASDSPATSECGPLICVLGAGRTAIIEPATGRVLDVVPAWLSDLGVGELLAWTEDDGIIPNARTRIYDPRRRAVINELPGAIVASLPVDATRALILIDASRDRPTDVYAIEPDGSLHIIITIPSVGYCATAADHLVCLYGGPNDVGPATPLAVSGWRVPRRPGG